MPIKTILKRFLPVLLAISLLTYTLRSMPLASLTNQLQLASPMWTSLAALVVTVQTLLRAIRWRMLLLSLGYHPTLGRSLIAMMAGNVSGLILPGSGELIRCTILQRADAIPIPQSIGTVVAERFVDLIAIAVFMVITLLLQTSRLLDYVHQYVTLPQLITKSSGLQLLLYGTALLLALLTTLWLLWLGWKRLPVRYQFREVLAGLRKGLASAYRVQNMPLYIVINMAIHGLSIICLFTLFRALPITESLSLSAALTLVTISSLGSITIPTQANLGSYHFLASRTLLAYNITLVNGIVWATFSHAVIILTSLLLSVIGFLLALRWLGSMPLSAGTLEEQKSI